MSEARFKSWITGPRWDGLPTELKKAACDLGLDIKIDSDKGLMCETVFFEVTGESKKVAAFHQWFQRTGREYVA